MFKYQSPYYNFFFKKKKIPTFKKAGNSLIARSQI